MQAKTIVDELVDELAVNILESAKFFNERFGGIQKQTQQAQPTCSLDMIETDSGYQIIIDVPGMTKDEISLEITSDNTLLLYGKKRETKDNGYKYMIHERTCKGFSRQVKLPLQANTESIEAVVDNGVLIVKICKISNKSMHRKINVAQA